MVIGIAFREAVRAGIFIAKGASRYYRAESKLFDRAYTGWPRSVRMGVRHGSAIGAGVGGLFVPQEDLSPGLQDNGEDAFSPQNGFKTKSRKFYKTRYRYQRFSSSRRRKCKPPFKWR